VQIIDLNLHHTIVVLNHNAYAAIPTHQSSVTPIRQRGDHQTHTVSEVLKTVEESGVNDANLTLHLRVLLLGVHADEAADVLGWGTN
jgi:hypothetical protein